MSIERSHERRRRHGATPGLAARDLLPPVAEGPGRPRPVAPLALALADPPSGGGPAATRLPLPSKRGLSVAALLAVSALGGGRNGRRPERGIGRRAGRRDAFAGRRRGRAPARAGHLRRRSLRPADRACTQALAALARPGGRRHRRAGNPPRARHAQRPRAQAPRRGQALQPRRERAAARVVAACRRCSAGSACPPTACSARRPSARSSAGSAGAGSSADGVAGPVTRRALGLGSGPMLKRGGGAWRDGRDNASAIVRRVVAAGNRIAYKPYKYGGGHGSFRDSGYDCSGSVSYALHGGGLLRPPRCLGRVHQLRAPGPRQAHHDLRQLRARVHGHRRPPLRHQRPPHQRIALDLAPAQLGGLRGAPPRGPLATPSAIIGRCPAPTAASPPAPAGRCTWATCAPRCSPGCSRARRARGSCCGSRTSTRSGHARSTSAAQIADLRAIGIDWDGEPVRQSERHRALRGRRWRELEAARARLPVLVHARRDPRGGARPRTARCPRAPTRAPAAT